MYESSGKPMVLKDCLSDLNHNVISRMVFGEKYSNESVTKHELKEMIDELFSFGVVSDIGEFFPLAGVLGFAG